MLDLEDVPASGTIWQDAAAARQLRKIPTPWTPKTDVSTVAHQPEATLPVALSEGGGLKAPGAQGVPRRIRNGNNLIFAVVADARQLGRGHYKLVATSLRPAPAPAASVPAAAGSSPDVSRRIKKHLEHLEFLREVSTKGANPPVERHTATLARRAWWAIWEATGFALPVPSACTGPDGQMFYSWDQGRHHLELEIIPGKPAEFFYRDRETGQFWGDDYTVGDALPTEVAQKLKYFI